MKPREGLAKGNTYLQDYVDAKLEAVSEIFKQMSIISTLNNLNVKELRFKR